MEKQARSEALDRVAEFCKLDRQDSEAKKEIMGMRLPVYNAPAKKSIELSLPWHSFFYYFFMYPGTLMILEFELITVQGQLT